MRRTAARAAASLAVACLATPLAPAPARAQWTGTLGIYDDAAMSLDHGIMDGHVKEVFIGLRYDAPNAGDGMTGLEFSVAGLEPFVH
jgi:hypothetical protein